MSDVVTSEKSELPSLRGDLSLIAGAPSLNGEPRWLIYDPLRHRYFEIGVSAFEIISVWCSKVSDLRSAVESNYSRLLADAEVAQVERFLLSNNLTELPPNGSPSGFADQSRRRRRGIVSRVLHGYLFFRVPLVRPQALLIAASPFVAPLYTRWFLVLTCLIGLTGVYLVSRQWDQFISQFPDFFTFEGLLLYALSLVAIKVLHELGHAFTAIRYGVRVPTIGIAFMVLFPMLYTDVTDAWRLRSRKQRLAIASSGIAVELAIACFATFAWAILPDGPGKSVAFVLATSSWVLSLAVNLNPLMRFDGYYILMDYWGIPNLQSRSFAIARWWLREALFGLGHAPPDEFTATQRVRLTVYAVATWIYRFFLFLGIALAVYYLFFKALGVFLFVVEILYFIIFPVAREIEAWWLMRSEIKKSRRIFISSGALLALLGVVFIPWSGTVNVPAILEAEQRADVFASNAAVIDRVLVSEGALVNQGDLLVSLQSSDLTHRLEQAQRRRELAERRIARAASGVRERVNLRVLRGELAAAVEAIEGLRREISELAVRAPISGRVVDLNKNLHVGRWVNRKTALARVVSPQAARVAGLAKEDLIARISPGAVGKFVPDDVHLPRRDVQLAQIARVATQDLQRPYFASVFDGRVSAEREKDGRLQALGGHYKLHFAVDGEQPAHVTRGIVRLEAEPESIASAIVRNILRVAVREASI